jgi:hypothetical protein
VFIKIIGSTLLNGKSMSANIYKMKAQKPLDYTPPEL